MSSSGRFQSHLFNFVSKQAHKLADQTKKAVRHLKIATIWGTQILLYPIYVLVQSTRLIGQQIGQTVRRSRLHLSKVSEPSPTSELLTVDTPIQRVLTAVQESWLLTSAESTDPESVQSLTQTSVSSLATIQGIASVIPTRKLVLVTIANQIMDVLTIEQQDHLKQRIIWEMANYWRYWRRHYIAQAHSTLLLPLEDHPTLLPPVRVFRQLMAWVQSGSIAIAANLFQESALVTQPTLDWFTTDLTLSAFNPVGLIPRIPTTAELSGLIQQLPSLREMESLIRAAMRHFFGDRPRKQLAMGVDDETAIAEDLWLTSDEVFGKTGKLQAAKTRSHLRRKTVNIRIEKTFTPLAHLPAQADGLSGNSETLSSQPEVSIGHSLQNWLKRSLPQQKSRPRSNPIVHQRPNQSRLTQATKPQPLTKQRKSSQSLEVSLDRTLTETSKKPLRSTPPDYIETKATPIGYVKSPLTKFLEWLDTGIVWLERKLAALWNFLTRGS
jgi:hypothetical protein